MYNEIIEYRGAIMLTRLINLCLGKKKNTAETKVQRNKVEFYAKAISNVEKYGTRLDAVKFQARIYNEKLGLIYATDKQVDVVAMNSIAFFVTSSVAIGDLVKVQGYEESIIECNDGKASVKNSSVVAVSVQLVSPDCEARKNS